MTLALVEKGILLEIKRGHLDVERYGERSLPKFTEIRHLFTPS